MPTHSLSVIVSSYNQPNTLRLVLAGFAAQDDRDFELIVADDGSDGDTCELVDAFRESAPFDVRFVTQEHTSFHKARIQNQGILVSGGDQLLFCDGDCVPFRNLVRVHRRAYRPGGFCVGACKFLDLDQSRRLTPESVAQGAHERLLATADRLGFRWVHLKNKLYVLQGKKDKPKILGGNWSVDRGALLEVDGFEESYEGFGGEDSDLRNRLRNIGARPISLWHRAFVCHLNHALDPRRCSPDVRRARRDPNVYYSSLNRRRAIRGLSQAAADSQDSR